ncbi:alpha/beta fold hydrolase [Polymorphum gilvum]|uniref:Predicted hydrolase or acyltransferase n=1 Tax=Polymorphum gilvum (strain LMG 25793 / CGMCC 1.9160 / SL003B-26A1) TaxID=991905 RepID=F2J008_POLGS|nr:alpha/beta hydrolase [Polymorphum gilvum]ADZ71843.1 Predicted hydrolase or acyltransferase [Polymorphum gilvum SL003B-26A1]
MSLPPDLPDLFPGFRNADVEGDGATIHCRIGGNGPPLLLLHGYPQSHVMWHRIAPELARRFTLVIADLRGYGQSSVPAASPDHASYSKRAMAADMVAVMDRLGHRRFAVCGHDRGARVGYRLALDHPERVARIAVLDILPTWDYWRKMDRAFALRVYHWAFLSQPAPMPERLIAGDAVGYLEHTLASWTAAKNLTTFAPEALAHYRAAYVQPERIRAMCDDYRAGAFVDFEHDAADRAAGRRIAAPLLALWGGTGIAQGADTPLDVWRQWADDASGEAIDSGHFVAEENPAALLALLVPFLEAAS